MTAFAAAWYPVIRMPAGPPGTSSTQRLAVSSAHTSRSGSATWFARLPARLLRAFGADEHAGRLAVAGDAAGDRVEVKQLHVGSGSRGASRRPLIRAESSGVCNAAAGVGKWKQIESAVILAPTTRVPGGSGRASPSRLTAAQPVTA